MMALPSFTYTFRPDQKIKSEFLRILGEISTRGRCLGRPSRGPPDEAIHEGRLLIKRLRALLWFVRPALGLKTEERAKVQLRKAAGLMSSQRDGAVAQKMLDDLAEKAKEQHERADMAEISRGVRRNFPNGTGTELKGRKTVQEAMKILRRSVVGIRRHAAGSEEWPSPEKRLKKAFHHAEKAGKKARESGSDTDFHSWRKKTKRLFYELELTGPAPTGPRRHLMQHVEKLQDALGLIHDCAVTEEHLRRMERVSSRRSFLPLLAKRKAHLQKMALKEAGEIPQPPGGRIRFGRGS